MLYIVTASNCNYSPGFQTRDFPSTNWRGWGLNRKPACKADVPLLSYSPSLCLGAHLLTLCLAAQRHPTNCLMRTSMPCVILNLLLAQHEGSICWSFLAPLQKLGFGVFPSTSCYYLVCLTCNHNDIRGGGLAFTHWLPEVGADTCSLVPSGCSGPFACWQEEKRDSPTMPESHHFYFSCQLIGGRQSKETRMRNEYFGTSIFQHQNILISYHRKQKNSRSPMSVSDAILMLVVKELLSFISLLP